jgi:hypothetical protein
LISLMVYIFPLISVIVYIFPLISLMVYIFPLISLIDVVSINKLTLKLKMISQCEVKHMTLPIKTITLVLKFSTYMFTSITARCMRLAVILVIMSAIILYVF